MRTYEARATAIHKRSRLPHWDTAHGIQFVTFHLADAIPDRVRHQIELEAEAQLALIRRSRGKPTEAETRGIAAFVRAKLQDALDAGLGDRILEKPQFAELVSKALEHFDGERYQLIAWCVMPNHVHALMRQRRVTIPSIVHSWKSFTAKRINAGLGRMGELWQKDYWDHVIRDSRELERTVSYVMNNPCNAGLRDWPFVRRYDDRFAALF